MLKDILNEISDGLLRGVPSAIPSFCVANPLAIKSVMLYGKNRNKTLLFESTSNQVNQLGGYTGMTPVAYKEKVYSLACEVGFPLENIILGGDHLGPLPFSKLPAKEAMKLAEDMIKSYVNAGYTKLHIDTCMHLGDDDASKALPKDLIAERGVVLIDIAEKEFQQYLKTHPQAVHPLYIIGSEVPPAGGQDAFSKDLSVTSVEEAKETLVTFEDQFKKYGISSLWKYVVAVVVQPGVEYGNDNVVQYDRFKAKQLADYIRTLEGDLIYEGHSTDYQTKEALKNMVEDGVGILKVGPALTAAVKEALVNLEKIESLLLPEEGVSSDFAQVLSNVMRNDNSYWCKYYKGSPKEVEISLRFSLLDRSRYYLGEPDVVEAVERLLRNVNEIEIPAGVLKQFFPMQFKRLGWRHVTAMELIADYVAMQIEDYDYATSYRWS